MDGACDECGRSAALVVDHEGVRSRLCVDCASLRSSVARIAPMFALPRRRDGICPYCGSTMAEIKATGLAGCPLCYEVGPDAMWTEFGMKL